ADICTQALEVCQKLSETFPKDRNYRRELSVIHNQRGIAYHRLGDNEKALNDSIAASELNPDDPVVWYNRGLARHRLKQYAEAAASNSKALEINPKFVLAYQGLATALQALRDRDGAIAVYRQALVALGPDHPEVPSIQIQLALAHEALGNRAEAIRLY